MRVVVSTLASMPVPMHTTAVTASATPIWRSARSLVVSACTTWVSMPACSCTVVLAEVDAEHLVAEVDERLGQRRTEPAEPDHDDLALVLDRDRT